MPHNHHISMNLSKQMRKVNSLKHSTFFLRYIVNKKMVQCAIHPVTTQNASSITNTFLNMPPQFTNFLTFNFWTYIAFSICCNYFYLPGKLTVRPGQKVLFCQRLTISIFLFWFSSEKNKETLEND